MHEFRLEILFKDFLIEVYKPSKLVLLVGEDRDGMLPRCDVGQVPYCTTSIALTRVPRNLGLSALLLFLYLLEDSFLSWCNLAIHNNNDDDDDIMWSSSYSAINEFF